MQNINIFGKGHAEIMRYVKNSGLLIEEGAEVEIELPNVLNRYQSDVCTEEDDDGTVFHICYVEMEPKRINEIEVYQIFYASSGLVRQVEPLHDENSNIFTKTYYVPHIIDHRKAGFAWLTVEPNENTTC